MLETLERELSSAIILAAQKRPLTPELIQQVIPTTVVGSPNRTHRLKTLIKIVKDSRAKGHLGKLRGAILVGATLLGPAFISAVERAGALICDETAPKKWGAFIEALQSEVCLVHDPAWSLLNERLASYRAYQMLVVTQMEKDKKVLRLLRTRPRHVLKKILVLTELAFQQHYLGLEVPAKLSAWFDELGPPEEVASVASVLVDKANEFSPLDSFDFTVPETGELIPSDVHAVVEYGILLSFRYEVAKHLSLFSSRLEATNSGGRWIFYLRPASNTFEYALRLGFIRSEMSRSGIPAAVKRLDEVPRLSLKALAEAIGQKFHRELCELMDPGTPFRRIKFNVPLGLRMYDSISRDVLYDDVEYLERLNRDLLIPPTSEFAAGVRLTDNLDLHTFYRIWKYLKFLCLISIAAARMYAKTDFTLLRNSIIRVVHEDGMVEIITQLGVNQNQANDFLQLVSADVRHLGYFDVQYRPFLRIATTTLRKAGITTHPEIVFFPMLIAAANEVRNVQSANKLRMLASGQLFVEAVGNSLRKRFKNVTLNRKVEAGNMRTDVDVIILDQCTLYLFECKHSIPPTSPHEMRDLWEDIEKGCKQLALALEILKDPDRLLAFLAGWFPGTKRHDVAGLTIVPCVLCSHPIYSGLDHEGIPVRDFGSLAKLLEDGVVGMGGTAANGELIMHRFRLVSENGFSSADLDDYLSVAPRFFRIFSPFMYQVSRFQQVQDIVMARETYTYQTSLAASLAHMQAMGFVRLPDERTTLIPPFTAEDLLSRFKNTSPHSDSK